MDPWELLAAVSRLQHMLFTTWQAEAVGVHRSTVSARVRRQGWPRYERGVTGWPGDDPPLRRLAALVLAYARPTAGASRIELPQPELQQDVSAHALGVAAAALRAGHVISGRSGAWLHGFGPTPKEHEIWLPPRSGRAIRQGAVLRYGGAVAGDTVWIHNLPVFDPVGCIIETARTPVGTFSARVDEVVWQISKADALRVVTIDSLEDRALDLGAFTGCEVLRAAIGQARGTLSHSRTEQRARALAREAVAPLGLDISSRPYAVRIDGCLIGEADIAVPAIRFDIEIDGPHHRLVAQRTKDQERDRLLRRAGWEVERFTIELVRDRPKVFVARVRDAAQARLEALSAATAGL